MVRELFATKTPTGITMYKAFTSCMQTAMAAAWVTWLITSRHRLRSRERVERIQTKPPRRFFSGQKNLENNV